MKRNWMAFCLAAALMTAGTVYAKPAPSQLVPEKHGQCYVEDNLFVKDVNGAGGGQGVLHGDFAFRREQALKNGRHQGNRLDDAETWILYWQSHAQG